MSCECQKYKDKIIDFVSGLLEESETDELQKHLESCPECNEYVNALKSEDKLLTDYFTQVDSDMQIREQKVLDAINTPEQKETSSRTILKPLIKLAVAAAIIITALIINSQFTNSNLVWADVMEQLNAFRPYASTHTTYADGTEPKTQRVLRLSLTQRRQIFPDGRITIFDLGNAKSLTLYPEQKRAIERTYKSSAKDADIFAIARSMQDMKYGAVQELGQKEIEGHITKGFHSGNEYDDITLWVDVRTKLPVQFEVIQIQLGRTLITNEIEFDVDFDESLFSTTAPEGYTVEKEEVPDFQEFVQSTTENDLIEGLRALAVFLDGTLPPDIEQLPALQTLLREYVERKNLSDSEIQERLTPVSDNYTKAYYYMIKLKGMGVTFNYVGEGVKLGDSEAPIMWWLPKDSATYRVIYGDLRVADLEPENLPK